MRQDESISLDTFIRYAPAAPVAFGGILLALIFDQSRKPQFRCELCGTTFSSHTIRSALFSGVLGVFSFVCGFHYCATTLRLVQDIMYH